MQKKKGSRIQVLRGNADKTSTGMTANKLTQNSNGRVVSKAKSVQGKTNIKGNPNMLFRQIAVQELSTRDDAQDMFKAGNNKMKEAVAKRHKELLNLPIEERKRLLKEHANKSAKKNNNKSAKKNNNKSAKKNNTRTKKKKNTSRGGLFY